MENNLAKSLTDLIDETLAEIEALKKSDRFAAEEIEMGHDADGDMRTEEVAAKAEDEEHEEEKEDEEEHEDEAKKAEKAYWKAEEECEKAEHAYKEAMKKREMCKAECDKYMGKKEDKDDKEDKKEDKDELSKSIDAKIAPIQSQISELLSAVKQLAEAPVPARGATYKHVQALAKGAVEEEPLNKAQVLNELITLKKSGKEVSIEDVLKAEIGGAGELLDIANKYGIK